MAFLLSHVTLIRGLSDLFQGLFCRKDAEINSEAILKAKINKNG